MGDRAKQNHIGHGQRALSHCAYCGKCGHTKDRCWKLYPPFKSNVGKITTDHTVATGTSLLLDQLSHLFQQLRQTMSTQSTPSATTHVSEMSEKKIPAQGIGKGTQEDPVTLYSSSSESSMLVWTPDSQPSDVEVIEISSTASYEPATPSHYRSSSYSWSNAGNEEPEVNSEHEPLVNLEHLANPEPVIPQEPVQAPVVDPEPHVPHQGYRVRVPLCCSCHHFGHSYIFCSYPYTYQCSICGIAGHTENDCYYLIFDVPIQCSICKQRNHLKEACLYYDPTSLSDETSSDEH